MDDRLTVVEKKKCVECGNDFDIRKGERDFYLSKGMLLPKRCGKCRLARRASIKTTMQIPIK